MLKNASKCTHNAWDCFQSARKRLLEWKWWEAGTGKGAYFSVSITAARAKISASRLPGTKNVTIWVRGPKTASWSRNFEKFLELDHVLMHFRGTFQNHGGSHEAQSCRFVTTPFVLRDYPPFFGRKSHSHILRRIHQLLKPPKNSKFSLPRWQHSTTWPFL